ncbi:protein of unknown function DUF982 [Rhizobium sp. CF080]|uniref:DUF982 domain-containing protein n=1 Tax=Rhizobium sp. (strain CF080) TaxID=1144310 RepID=UPI0002719A34|nr:DUF982 domain-containing protein [Rhizobium sp. CF080]EUB96545.1 protein of unknown function DUF982 [Rhizobium sp. CF080]
MKKRVKSDPNWPEPVIVAVGRRSPEIIRTPAEALIYLTNKWPAARNERYRTATEVCSAALRRQIDAAAARETFLSAALEAGMLQ